jgi:hypothetical protein
VAGDLMGVRCLDCEWSDRAHVRSHVSSALVELTAYLYVFVCVIK